MAVFALDRSKVSLLAGVLTAGLMHSDLMTASEEDEQAIAALLEELDAIACRNGSAEVTVMGGEQ